MDGNEEGVLLKEEETREPTLELNNEGNNDDDNNNNQSDLMQVIPDFNAGAEPMQMDGNIDNNNNNINTNINSYVLPQVPSPSNPPTTIEIKPSIITLEISMPLKEVDQLIHQNFELIQEATTNQNSTEPERIYRNATLVRQLDQNLHRIGQLYAEIGTQIHRAM
eukprot:TRINITY_DN3942_c0_g1_i1.p1 TRINITY_DN3942_c0_g1~~TRINITY_DN3942_c0_g1_i1.p1  ORF type:complete len:165 (+),score=53.18 TRINITY_DN3942_c0_g1_i1:3-497(+)